MAGSSLSSIRRLEGRGQGTLLLLARIAQALQVTTQFESFLVQPTASIADIERAVAATRRQRASRLRKRSGTAA